MDLEGGSIAAWIDPLGAFDNPRCRAEASQFPRSGDRDDRAQPSAPGAGGTP
jgi:hypothetical protein